MKNIEFRVWIDAFDGEMIYPEWIKFNSGGSIETPNYLGGIPMAFTGLLDKNKKKIFDGDIVKYTVHYDDLRSERYTGKVVWDEEFSTWTFITCPDGATYRQFPREVEKIKVIGNIYENSELIK